MANVFDDIHAEAQAKPSSGNVFDQIHAEAQPPKSVGGFLSNVVSSAGDTLYGVANAVRHPLDTSKAIGNVVFGGISKGLDALGVPDDPRHPKTSPAAFDSLIEHFKQRYGSLESAKEALYKDPVGTAMDASMVLGGVGAAADVANLGKVAKVARTASEITNPLNAIAKPAAAVVDATARRVARAKTTLLPEEIAAPLNTRAEQLAAEAKQAGVDAQAEIEQARRGVQDVRDAEALKAEKLAEASKQAGVDAQAEIEKARKSVQAVKDQEAARVSAAKAAGAQTVQANTSATTTAAQSMQSRFSGALDDTKFGAIDDIAKAATDGDEHAARILKGLKDAKTPDQIQRASIGLQDYRTSKTASGLYDKVGELISSHNLPDIPLTQTDEVLSRLSKSLQNDLNPAANKNVSRVIGGILEQTSGTGEKIADLSYANVRRLDSSLGQMIRDGHTGDGALIGANGVQYLQQVRNAVRADMAEFAKASGIPDVVEAAKAADKFYQEVRVPFKQLDVARAATAVDADRIFDGFIKQGGGEKAQRYYDALDDKGRAAVRSQMVTDAINQATDNVHGTVDPAKLFEHLTKMQDPYGVFFKGKDKFELDGLRKIAKQMVLSNEAALTPPASGAGAIRAAKTAAGETIEQAQAKFAAAKDAASQSGAPAIRTARQGAADTIYQARARFTAAKEQAVRAAADAQTANETAAATNARLNKYPLGNIAQAGITAGMALNHFGMPLAGTVAYGVGGVAGLAKALTMTEKGRRYLLAGSLLQPGSPNMANLARRINLDFANGVLRVAAGAGQKPQIAPPTQ